MMGGLKDLSVLGGDCHLLNKVFSVAFTRIRAVGLLWRKVGEKERGDCMWGASEVGKSLGVILQEFQVCDILASDAEFG